VRRRTLLKGLAAGAAALVLGLKAPEPIRAPNGTITIIPPRKWVHIGRYDWSPYLTDSTSWYIIPPKTPFSVATPAEQA
jgi:hypothetical protein